jgi:DNA transformation protein
VEPVWFEDDFGGAPAVARQSRDHERRFVEHVLDMLQELGAARSRAMFGGYGIYLNGLMIGIVADSTLYLKVDDVSRPQFEAEGCRPFTYRKRGLREPIVMSYSEAPVAALESPWQLRAWARIAFEAAERSRK